MQKSLDIAAEVHRYLVPRETRVLKVQDVLLFHRKTRMVLLLGLINVFFAILSNFHISIYSLVCLLIGMRFTKPVISGFIDNYLLSDNISDIPPTSLRQRFTIAQISAALCTTYYIYVQFAVKIRSCLASGDYLSLIPSVCAVASIFQIAFSVSAVRFLWILSDFALLFPISMRVAESIRFFG